MYVFSKHLLADLNNAQMYYGHCILLSMFVHSIKTIDLTKDADPEPETPVLDEKSQDEVGKVNL